MPMSTVVSSTPTIAAIASRKSVLRHAQYRRISPTSMRLSTAVITMAPRTALGRLLNSGASRSAVARIKADVTSDDTWDFAPALSAVAVWDRLASAVNPPNRPVPMLAAPRATISWSASIS